MITTNNAKLDISKKMKLHVSIITANYKLKGIGEFHFISYIIITSDFMVVE
jgi:hypothetical protein